MLPTPEWTAHRLRLKDEHAAGWLTAAQYLALVTIDDLSAAGIDDPPVSRIAMEARCSASTVRRARAIGEARGLLIVTPRFENHMQLTNRYQRQMPHEPVKPRPRAPSQCDCPSGSKIKKSLIEPPKSAKQQILALGFSADQVAEAARIARERAVKLRLTI